MMRQVTVKFTHSTSYNGTRLEKAEVRELNGHDQEKLVDAEAFSSMARMNAILANVVEFEVGEDKNETRQLLNNLAVGDFVSLVLELRKLTFGEMLKCQITCPNCKQEMTADFPTAQITQNAQVANLENSELNIGEFALKLRPATCADLIFSTADGQSPREQLARKCILESSQNLPETFEAAFLTEISAKLAELDPQADILLDFACPNCGHTFQAPFYPEDFFLRELNAIKAQFEGEVHWLAFNYHWGENEILALPLSKRRRYIDLINETLSGGAM